MFCQQIVENLDWLPPAQRLPWPPVQLYGHAIKLLLGMQGQVGALREITVAAARGYSRLIHAVKVDEGRGSTLACRCGR